MGDVSPLASPTLKNGNNSSGWSSDTIAAGRSKPAVYRPVRREAQYLWAVYARVPSFDRFHEGEFAISYLHGPHKGGPNRTANSDEKSGA